MHQFQAVSDRAGRGGLRSQCERVVRARPRWWLLAVYMAAYIVGGGLGQRLAIIPGVTIIFWPPAGLFVATLLASPRPSWSWWILVGGLAELVCNALWFGNPLGYAVAYYLANAIEAMTAASLIRWMSRSSFRLETLREAAILVFFGAMVAPVTGATAIAVIDALRGKHEFTTAWPLLWLGDGTGLLVSAPLTLWVIQAYRARGEISRERMFELAVLLLVFLAAGYLYFWGYVSTAYLLLPALLWAAARFQLSGASAALALVTLLMATMTPVGTSSGWGSPEDARRAIVSLQMFLGISAASALLVATLSAQHQQVLCRLHAANAALEATVVERTRHLRESEGRLKLFIENAPAAIAMFDREMRYLAASRRWRTDYAPGSDALLGRSHYEVFPDLPEAWKEAHRRGLAGECLRSDADRFERSSGQVQWIQWEILPWRTDDQSIGGILIAAEDITERYRAAEALEERNRQLALLTSTSQRLILCDRVTNDLLSTILAEIGQLISMESFDYYAVSDRVGTLGLVSSHRQDGNHDSHMEAEGISELLCCRMIERRDALIVENSARAPLSDRALLMAAGLKSCAVFPLQSRGVLVGAVAFFSETRSDLRASEVQAVQTLCDQLAITLERTRLIDELEESERRLRLILEGADLGSWDVELRSGHAEWNQRHASLLGFTAPPAQATMEMWRSRVHAEDLDRVLASIDRACRDHTLFSDEHRLRPDERGGTRWLSLSGRFVYSEQGEPIRFSGVSRDITEQKRAELALRDVDRRKDEFLATLAHELRNPLAPVRNAVQILHLKGPAVPELQWARDVIDRQVRAMTRLIDDLMDVSRISRGKFELRHERVEFAKVVQDAIETSRPLIEEMQHELLVKLPAGPVWVDADLTRLAQVFWNLLNNAAKYTEPGGRIELLAECRGREIMTRVRDTGIGIPCEKLPTIFEMFSQVEGALARSQGGLGIGLSLAKHLVEMHGGRITVHSDGPGTGSEFVVCLPLVEIPGESPAAPQSIEQVRLNSRFQVLVVDDNQDAAATLRMLLGALGSRVEVAHDGLAALAAVERSCPHVVLCDIGLPKLNGYDVCRAVRAAPWGRDIVMVAVTGWGQEADRQQAQEAGFDHHLVKPVAPQALMELLARLDATLVR